VQFVLSIHNSSTILEKEIEKGNSNYEEQNRNKILPGR
jgi:hypothetical protein